MEGIFIPKAFVRVTFSICLSMHLCNCSMSSNTKSNDAKVYLDVSHDFEEIFTTIHLIKGIDTLHNYNIDECYGKGGEIMKVNDSIFQYTYELRGGYGIERENSIVLLVKNNTLTKIFEISVKDDFEDTLFNLKDQKRQCEIEFENDSIKLTWLEFENQLQKLNVIEKYETDDLIKGKAAIRYYW